MSNEGRLGAEKTEYFVKQKFYFYNIFTFSRKFY